MPLPELTMLFELDGLFQEFLSSPRRPRYGISVTDAAPDLSVISAELRFLKDRSYCCAEATCHIPRRCDRLVLLASKRSIQMPDDVEVHWRCIVKEGARLQCLEGLGIPTESKAYEFTHVSGGPSSKKESATPPQNPPPDFTGLWINDHGGGARVETEYVAGVPNGRYRSWNEEGVCLREGFKKNGQWDGELITRNSDGTVLDVSTFNEGTGIYKIFNSNGRLTDEIPMQHGKPHGTAKRWVCGELVEMRHYVEGQCVAVNCLK
jgi:hypothetical protein